jgi:HlyD family secretion protein
MWISLVILVVVATMVVRQKTKLVDPPQFIEISKQDLRQKVSVTGTVKPIDSLNLTFEQNGKIEKVNVKTGDRVKKGDVLITLTSQELWAQQKQAQAELDLANALSSEKQNAGREAKK